MHPILGFTRALGAALDRVLVHEPAFLTPEEKRTVLVELARQRTRLEALELQVLAAADRDDLGRTSYVLVALTTAPHDVPSKVIRSGRSDDQLA